MATQQEFAAILWKLKAWLATHPNPDEPIIGLAERDQELTPREIVRQVEKRTPEGEHFIDRWLALVGFHQIMAAPFASERSQPSTDEPTEPAKESEHSTGGRQPK